MADKDLDQRSKEILGYVEHTLSKGQMSLVNIHRGAIIEKFDMVLNNEVLPNIKDINTTGKAREINIKISIAPLDDNRHIIGYGFQVTPKLQPHEPVGGTADIDVDFLEASKPEENLFLYVVNHVTVSLRGQLQPKNDNARFRYATSKLNISSFQFGHWVLLEDFVVVLMSQFVETPDREKLINWLGALANENVIESNDDGFSQSIQIRTGISNKSEVKIENPITLKPFRTFSEVDQPESTAIFRLRKDGTQLKCALFESDGGAWKLEAVANIKEWLKGKVDIPVIA